MKTALIKQKIKEGDTIEIAKREKKRTSGTVLYAYMYIYKVLYFIYIYIYINIYL